MSSRCLHMLMHAKFLARERSDRDDEWMAFARKSRVVADLLIVVHKASLTVK